MDGMKAELKMVENMLKEKREEINYLREYGQQIIRNYATEREWTQRKLNSEIAAWRLICVTL